MNSFDEHLMILKHHALQEDIGNGDHSTLCCIPAGARGRAILKIKQAGILAGVEVASRFFKSHEPGVEFISHKKDGDTMNPGETAFEVAASIHTILQLERLVLNCMQRMSGIATLTAKYVQLLKGYHTRVLDTRKTTPNFRVLEKEAVKIGGGVNHRMGLYDMIMLKDNHIDYAGGIEVAIDRAWEYIQLENLNLEIEVETRSLEEVSRVIKHGKVHRIMLDNFTADDVASAVEMIGKRFITEASGGITLDNIVDYAKTNVDFVSVGALIHQAQSVDLSLKAIVN